MLGRKSELEIAAREAEKKRDTALKELDENREKLLAARKRAEGVVCESMLLLNSVSSVPLRFRKDMTLIGHEQKRFRRSDEIVKSQFARDAAALGVAAIATTGFAGIVWKARSKVTELFKSKKSIVAVGISALVAAFLLGVWKASRLFARKNAEEWRKQADECIKEARSAKDLSCQAEADEKLISSHSTFLGSLLASAEGARGKKFRCLSPELQDTLTQLLSNTQWLARLLNGEVVS